jgi:uncharacterized protein (DUF433 family)
MDKVNYPPVQHIEVRDGQARISGRPLKVKMVISRIIHGSATIDEVMEQYNLTRAEVHAVIAYYFDHKEQIDRYFEEEEKQVAANVTPLDELLSRLRARKDQRD